MEKYSPADIANAPDKFLGETVPIEGVLLVKGMSIVRPITTEATDVLREIARPGYVHSIRYQCFLLPDDRFDEDLCMRDPAAWFFTSPNAKIKRLLRRLPECACRFLYKSWLHWEPIGIFLHDPRIPCLLDDAEQMPWVVDEFIHKCPTIVTGKIVASRIPDYAFSLTEITSLTVKQHKRVRDQDREVIVSPCSQEFTELDWEQIKVDKANAAWERRQMENGARSFP